MPEEPIDETQLPLWFRAAEHTVTTGGIVRNSDWAVLDDEGRPQSQALRAAEERAPAEAKAAGEAKKQPRKEAADADQ